MVKNLWAAYYKCIYFLSRAHTLTYTRAPVTQKKSRLMVLKCDFVQTCMGISLFLVSFLSIATHLFVIIVSRFLSLLMVASVLSQISAFNHFQTYTKTLYTRYVQCCQALNLMRQRQDARRCFRQLFLLILHYFFMAKTTFQSDFYKVSNPHHFRKLDCAVCVCSAVEYVCA